MKQVIAHIALSVLDDLTDVEDGREHYRSVIERELPGDHPSLRVERNPRWLELFA